MSPSEDAPLFYRQAIIMYHRPQQPNMPQATRCTLFQSLPPERISICDAIVFKASGLMIPSGFTSTRSSQAALLAQIPGTPPAPLTIVCCTTSKKHPCEDYNALMSLGGAGASYAHCAGEVILTPNLSNAQPLGRSALSQRCKSTHEILHRLSI